jgi:hypothetical protein
MAWKCRFTGTDRSVLPLTRIRRQLLLAYALACACAVLLVVCVHGWVSTPAGAASADTDAPRGPYQATAGADPCFHQPAHITASTDRPNVPIADRVLVTPAVVDQRSIPAGTTLHCAITVRNRRSSKGVFELELAGAKASTRPGTGPVQLIDRDDPGYDASAASWVTLDAPRVELQSRGVAAVPFDVHIPDAVDPGGHYAALLVRTNGTYAKGKGPSLGYESQVAVMLLLDVKGGHHTRAMQLRDAQAPSVRWNREPYTLTATVRNTGTTHVRPAGTLVVHSIFGGDVAELPVDMQPALPGGRSYLRTTWKGVPWFGYYRVELRLHPQGADSPTIGATRHVWALPPLWVLIVIVVFLVALAIGWLRSRGGVDRRGGDSDDPDDNDFEASSHAGYGVLDDGDDASG